ncbi:MAG TPA: fused MFS/spermidine synthase [Acidobacteriota bacterium]|nr:fused MFS/spermidine synthase [Acidobacteriota bacterium]
MHRLSKIALLLFGSGMCALIYQTTWLREFRLIFGGSTAASAAVIAIFMGGLGVGSAILGKGVDKRANPLAFYSNLELAIALSAAATPALIWLARQAYMALGGSLVLGLGLGTVLRLLLATLVLCVPTFLMGGTLPAAGRAVETETDLARRNLALLYGVNTLGAVTGAAISTFLLLELLGNRKTLWLACLVNVVVALAARSLSRSMADLGAKPEGTVTAAAPLAARQIGGLEPAQPHDGPPAAPLFVLVAATVVGFAFLLMELVWYRMLGPLLGGTSFTFGLILAVALLGVGLGGAAYAFFWGDRSPSLCGFAFTCALEALCVAFPFALGDRIAILAMLLRSLGSLGFYGFVLGWTVVAVLVVLPAAFVAGVQFPLLIALLGKGKEHVGRDVGLAYAWNTAGAIGGALAGGFGLLPLLTAPGPWRAVVLIVALLSVAAIGLDLFARRLRWRRSIPAFGAALISFALLFALGPTAAWRHSQIGAGRANNFQLSRNPMRDWIQYQRRSVKWEAEGVESSVALTRNEGYAFVVNGKIDGHARGDAGTQVMSGLIGAILHPNPKSALVVGLGTGSTAGWLGAVPSIERVDVVELEPVILQVARECQPVNARAMENPKIHIAIGDGRETLLVAPQRYDMIVSEPSNPYRAGIASLFTQDFYRAAAKRLNDGGFFLQWIQAYEVDSQTVRTAYCTLASVFPVVETFQTTISDLLLVGSARPISYQAGALRERLQQEPFRTAMRQSWRSAGLEGFLSHYVSDNSFARAIAQQEKSLLNTDDRNLIEFGFARNLGNVTNFDVRDLRELARSRGEDRPAVTGGVDWNSVEDQRVAFFTEYDAKPPLLSSFSREQRLRAEAQISYLKGDYKDTLALWKSQPKPPSNLTELVMLAECLADAGEDNAYPYIETLRAVQPLEAAIMIARLSWRQHRAKEATAALEAAFERYREDPWPWQKLLERALDLAVTVATEDPDRTSAMRLHAALRQPFSVFLLNDKRLKSVLRIARRLDDAKSVDLSHDAVASFEPHIPWQGDFLLFRFECYQKTGDPRAAAAYKNLQQFVAGEPLRLSAGLERGSEGGPSPSK